MEEILATVAAVERLVTNVLLLTSIAIESIFRWTIDQFQDVGVAEVYLIILIRCRPLGRRCISSVLSSHRLFLVILLERANSVICINICKCIYSNLKMIVITREC